MAFAGLQHGIAARLGTMSLPYDAEVEYLKSDGNACINLGVRINYGAKISIDYLIEQYSKIGIVFGAWQDSGSRTNILQLALTSSTYLHYDHIAGSYSVSLTYNQKATFAVSVSSGSGYTTPKAYLFARGYINSGATVDTYQLVLPYCRIYKFYMNNGDGTVIDMIPVRKGGVGYMYDKISGKLFGNAASSGAFTWAEKSAA